VSTAAIAESAIEAARAGAAIAHIDVRDPETGKGSRDVALYREVVERVRAADADGAEVAAPREAHRLTKAKSPVVQGLSMRRRGLEPPPS
jgi:uncharacterized protein (DUF849 family)